MDYVDDDTLEDELLDVSDEILDDFVLVDIIETPETAPTPPTFSLLGGIYSAVSSILSWRWDKDEIEAKSLEDFSTVKELQKYIRDIVLRFGVCESISSRSKNFYKFLRELYSFQPMADMPNVIDIAIVRGSYGNLHFSLIRSGNKSNQTLSWLQCISLIPKFANKKKPINPEAIKRRQLARAMRSAIFYQISEVKSGASNYECVFCKTIGTAPSEFHVDHIYPFCKLMNEFLATWSGQIPEKFEYSKGRIQLCPKDRLFELMWYDYHLKNAELQILCKKCNLKKGKKINEPFHTTQ